MKLKYFFRLSSFIVASSLLALVVLQYRTMSPWWPSAHFRPRNDLAGNTSSARAFTTQALYDVTTTLLNVNQTVHDVTQKVGDVTQKPGEVTSTFGDATQTHGYVTKILVDVTSTFGDVTQSSGDPLCPEVSPLLIGLQNVSTNHSFGNASGNWPPTLEETAVNYLALKLGGFYPGPRDCEARNTVAIIVPCRDREEHLRYLLHFLHGTLQRQQSRYVIVVVTQDDDKVFNKGQIMNAAFNYLTKDFNDAKIDCFIFHDVDMIPENDHTMYRCLGEDKVVHLSAKIDKYNYRFCCGMTVGGVLAMTRKQFETINGFSNVYYGWGGEDDDANNRIRNAKLGIHRLQSKDDRFHMVRHSSDVANPKNPNRHGLIGQWKVRQPHDGLNSLKVEVTSLVKLPTHTRLRVKPAPKQ